jgi:hypothetical protein
MLQQFRRALPALRLTASKHHAPVKGATVLKISMSKHLKKSFVALRCFCEVAQAQEAPKSSPTSPLLRQSQVKTIQKLLRNGEMYQTPSLVDEAVAIFCRSTTSDADVHAWRAFIPAFEKLPIEYLMRIQKYIFENFTSTPQEIQRSAFLFLAASSASLRCLIEDRVVSIATSNQLETILQTAMAFIERTAQQDWTKFSSPLRLFVHELKPILISITARLITR